MTERTTEIKELCHRFTEESSSKDPFLLADTLGVRVRYFPLGGLKGFYIVLQGVPFIALHRDLPEPLLRIVCAHELGHHLLHRGLASCTVFNEYDLYRMETLVEREANLFAAFLLIPDETVAALRRPEERGRSIGEMARSIGVTEELLAIRLEAEGLDLGVRLSRFPG